MPPTGDFDDACRRDNAAALKAANREFVLRVRALDLLGAGKQSIRYASRRAIPPYLYWR